MPSAASPPTTTVIGADRGADSRPRDTPAAAATETTSPALPGRRVDREVDRGAQHRAADRNRRGLGGRDDKPDQLGDHPHRGGDDQRRGGTAPISSPRYRSIVEHRDHGQTQRDDRRAVGDSPHQRRAQ